MSEMMLTYFTVQIRGCCSLFKNEAFACPLTDNQLKSLFDLLAIRPML